MGNPGVSLSRLLVWAECFGKMGAVESLWSGWEGVPAWGPHQWQHQGLKMSLAVLLGFSVILNFSSQIFSFCPSCTELVWSSNISQSVGCILLVVLELFIYGAQGHLKQNTDMALNNMETLRSPLGPEGPWESLSLAPLAAAPLFWQRASCSGWEPLASNSPDRIVQNCCFHWSHFLCPRLQRLLLLHFTIVILAGSRWIRQKSLE